MFDDPEVQNRRVDMGTDKKKEDSFSLEQTFEELEKIVEQLESDDISLETSFASYKKGMDMVASCNAYIDGVEKKVMVLNDEGDLDEF